MHSLTATQHRIAKYDPTCLSQSCVGSLSTEIFQNHYVNMRMSMR